MAVKKDNIKDRKKRVKSKKSKSHHKHKHGDVVELHINLGSALGSDNDY